MNELTNIIPWQDVKHFMEIYEHADDDEKIRLICDYELSLSIGINP